MCTWQLIHSAPFGRDLQLSVIEKQVHALAFPCRRTERGWVSSAGKMVDVRPSHWRDWAESETPCNCGASAGGSQ
jgi:hypothetical protein